MAKGIGRRGVLQGMGAAALLTMVAGGQSGAADAVVYDAPVLLYRASHADHGKVRVVGPVFRKESYGILLPSGSRLRKPINAALLALRETGAYRAVHANWFGQE